MGAVHSLRVKSPYKLLKIEKIEMENKPNEHGYLYLKCLIDDSIKFESTINASTEDRICVYEEVEQNLSEGNVDINKVDEGKSKILFNGRVQNIRTSNINGIYYLEIQALTSSFQLDIKEKSRSFQNANLTYDEIIGLVLKDYSGYNYTQFVGDGKKIGRPIFQYKETDWNFLKRLASELNSQLFCDIIEAQNMFYFGTPVKASYKIDDISSYQAYKDLKQYHKIGIGHDTDYFCYELERREIYEVGDKINFKNKELYVKERSTYSLKDEVIHKYKLCRKNGIWQTKMYNSLIGGAALEGKVLAVDGEKVKLHLDIDKNQDKGEASWFPYAPPTGSTMYSMPIVGTNARLYFPDENGEGPVVTGCVRKNGGSCAKTADTTKRYFGTEHGSELEMTPGAINIKGGSKEPLNVSFDDKVGVTITSPKKLILDADEEVIIKTPESVKIKAESKILATKKDSQSGFSIETEMHFKANNVIEDGRDRESYSVFNDEPKQGTKQEEKKEDKKKDGFSWGKLFKNVVAAVVVVAVVAVAASVIISTGGAAIPALAGVAGAMGDAALVGGLMMGLIGVAGKASSDISKGEVSDIGEYIWGSAKDTFVGAVCAAILEPFMAVKAVGGLIGEMPTTSQLVGNFVKNMFTGGMFNYTYYNLREAVDKRMPDTMKGLEEFKNGVLFSGFLHLGGAAISEASPFIKSAFNKIGAELSDTYKAIKIGLGRVEPSNTVRLGCGLGGGDASFGKKAINEIKKAMDEIKNGTKDVGKPAVNPSVEDILSGNARVPPKKKFDEWFDALTVEELETLCADSTSLKRIKDGLRAGGNHEWYKVSQVVKAKKWGVSLNDIKYDAVTKVNGAKDNDLWFVDIESKDGIISGRHSDGLKAEKSTHTSIENSASSLAHKELDALFDECKTKEEYLEKLNEWADNHLVITKKGKGLNNDVEDIVARGRDALPESIRRYPNE